MISLYVPGDSWLHRCPAGLKLLALAVLSLAASALARDPRGADDVDLVGAGDPRVPEARPAPAAPSAEDHPTDHLVTQEAR